MLLLLAVATAVSVAVGLAVTGPLDGTIGRWDRAVVEDLAAARSAWLDRTTGLTGLLSDVAPVAVLWVAATAAGASWTRRWEVPLLILFAVGGEKLTYLATSMLVDRPRPSVEPLGHVYSTGSFPSGHVGSAVTLYGSVVLALLWYRRAIERPLPRWATTLSLVAVAAVVAAVGFSRTFRGHHFPSDVAWGALLGITWLAIGWRVVLRPAPR